MEWKSFEICITNVNRQHHITINPRRKKGEKKRKKHVQRPITYARAFWTRYVIPTYGTGVGREAACCAMNHRDLLVGFVSREIKQAKTVVFVGQDVNAVCLIHKILKRKALWISSTTSPLFYSYSVFDIQKENREQTRVVFQQNAFLQNTTQCCQLLLETNASTEAIYCVLK